MTTALTFSEWIQQHAHGDLNIEMTDAMRDVAEGVLLVDKKVGKITLEIDLTKSGRMIVMSGQVKTKIPKPEAEVSTFYLSEGGLTRDDPYQLQAFDRGNGPLYEVGADGVLRDAADETAPADAPGSVRNPHPAPDDNGS